MHQPPEKHSLNVVQKWLLSVIMQVSVSVVNLAWHLTLQASDSFKTIQGGTKLKQVK